VTNELWYAVIMAVVVVVGFAFWKGVGLRMRRGAGGIEREVKERSGQTSPRAGITFGEDAELEKVTLRDAGGVITAGDSTSPIPGGGIDVFSGAKFTEVTARDLFAVKVGTGGQSDSSQAASQPPKATMRILFLAANPLTTSRLDLEEELHDLELELQAVTHRDHIDLRVRHAIRPDDLVRHVSEYKPTIVHFSGHGSPEGIVLRSDDGGYQPVSGVSLERFLRDRGIELLVLNACYSRSQADAIGDAVPSVVGTTSAVDDRAALRFTPAFYRSLGAGHTIREAFRDGGDAVALHGLDDVFQSSGELDRALVG
jgi:CHAT domain-containing protein